MLSPLLWTAFIVLFGLSRLRLGQTGGTRDRGVLLLFALGATTILATGLLVGWLGAGLMLVGWLALPYVVQPLVERLAGGGKSKKKGAEPNTQGLRMGRLDRGELSLADYFNEGRQDDNDVRKRLETLAARRDISEVLSKNRISMPQFFALHEQLIKVRELEWAILGTPSELEHLILLTAGAKTTTEIGNAFRKRQR
ncbi:MAG: hypothetical protein ABI609_18200 [Acidobacteriota bacterium]